SPRAQEYRRACERLAALPDIESQKVLEIKNRRQSGRYRIDADKIAEKMIRDALRNDE
nr:flagellar biosynthesis anti-sigma factor FlgM [Desulfobacterales bacterium]